MRVQRINEIVKGKRGVTAETALLLGKAFGTSPQMWLNLQSNHDLGKARVADVGPIRPAAPRRPVRVARKTTPRKLAAKERRAR